MIDPREMCPCKECKTRSVQCHSICPSYAKWKKLMDAYSKHVKQMQCKTGFGIDFNNPKGYIYSRRK